MIYANDDAFQNGNMCIYRALYDGDASAEFYDGVGETTTAAASASLTHKFFNTISIKKKYFLY